MDTTEVEESASTAERIEMPPLDAPATNQSEDSGIVQRGTRRARQQRIVLTVNADNTINWDDVNAKTKQRLADAAKADPQLAALAGGGVKPTDIPGEFVTTVTNAVMVPAAVGTVFLGPRISPDLAKVPPQLQPTIALFRVEKTDFTDGEMAACKRVIAKRGPAWIMKWQDEIMWAGVIAKTCTAKFDACVKASVEAARQIEAEREAARRPNGGAQSTQHRPL